MAENCKEVVVNCRYRLRLLYSNQQLGGCSKNLFLPLPTWITLHFRTSTLLRYLALYIHAYKWQKTMSQITYKSLCVSIYPHSDTISQVVGNGWIDRILSIVILNIVTRAKKKKYYVDVLDSMEMQNDRLHQSILTHAL